MNAQEIYSHFKKMPDAEHIATLINIEKIIDICKSEKPNTVVEMGGGIGAISYAILSNSNAFLYIYEENEYCTKRLHENLNSFKDRYEIIPNYHTLPKNRDAEFLIIDGGNKEVYCPEWYLTSYLTNLKTIYIEGFRRRQYQKATEGLFFHYVFRTTKTKEKEVNGEMQKGGTIIRCKKEESKIKRILSYIHVRLLENRRTKWFYRPLTGYKLYE